MTEVVSCVLAILVHPAGPIVFTFGLVAAACALTVIRVVLPWNRLTDREREEVIRRLGGHRK